MIIPNIDSLQPWEVLLKKIAITQFGKIKDKKILDFGSGNGFTANYFAKNNDVVAIEQSKEAVNERYCDNNYCQLIGSIDVLKQLEDKTFDMIFCHNVLEYVDNREKIVNEF